MGYKCSWASFISEGSVVVVVAGRNLKRGGSVGHDVQVNLPS